MNRAWREACLAQLQSSAFGIGVARSAPPRIGAEVELIPVEPASRSIAPIDHPERPSTRAALRVAGRRAGWTEQRSPKTGQLEFRTDAGGRVTFEPGGQVEYASPPLPSVSLLLADLRLSTCLIREALGEMGLEAVFAGIDPHNDVRDVPLQVDAPRYRRMDAHFASLGEHGARMMRQTASVQVNVDLGDDPLARWRLLNATAPYLAAIFANAPLYAGRQSDEASVRRLAWNRLDPSRTGLPWDATRPVEAYGDFAFAASALLGPVDAPPFPRFDLQPEQATGPDDWELHLSTLFPEIRPRGWFEVRSIDALEPMWYAAPIVMVAGLALDGETARDAADVAGIPDAGLLEAAGRPAVADPGLGPVARDLARLALQGAESLGPAMVSARDLDEARTFFDRFTWAGRVPADETAVTLS